jgi:hypothetical protein
MDCILYYVVIILSSTEREYAYRYFDNPTLVNRGEVCTQLLALFRKAPPFI